MADSLLGGIVINEILVDPNGALNFDTDGNGTADNIDEFIELYNASSSAIDISGLELWDAGVGHWFTFPAGSILQPGAHAMVMAGLSGGSYPPGDPDDLFFDAGRASPLINNGGDNVVVYDPSGDEYIIARFNGDTLDNPPAGGGGYSGFSATATQSGVGEDFGNDTDGLSLQRTGDGADLFDVGAPTPGITNICFANGTLIDTPKGPTLVEDLRPGDTILTKDRGPRSLSWVYSATWRPQDMIAHLPLAPVRISKGALGQGMPARDLYLSQHHRVLVQGPIALRMFGQSEVLVAAKALLPLLGVFLAIPNRAVDYHHVLLDAHEVLSVEGVWAESLYLGPQAVGSLPDAAVDELSHLLRLPLELLWQHHQDRARPFATGKRAQKLVERHKLNKKPIALSG